MLTADALPYDQTVERWAAAWDARRLEHLLACFANDAIYEDRNMELFASGSVELRKLFAAMFHRSDLRLRVEKVSGCGGISVIDWSKTGTRIPCADPTHSGPAVSYHRVPFSTVKGSTTLESDGTTIRACRDSWDMEMLVAATLWGRTIPRDVRPNAGIVDDDGKTIWINGLPIAKRQS